MSSSTWTPAALSSNRRRASGTCWRAVEAQHHVSTAKLTDTAAEQKRLEELLDQTKPAVPEECRHLDWLLYTPFRYPAIYPKGSRFRKAGLTLGVFYAAELAETAIAELAFHRLLFFAESPATPWPANAGEFTTFSVEYATGNAVDLTLAPLDTDAATWMHLTNYSGCQALAEAARTAGIEVIKYQSVRDPDHHLGVAIMTCRVFTRPDPLNLQTWRIHLSATGARAIREFPKSVIHFDRATFAADPRLKAMTWDRTTAA
jgi:RES domain